MAKYDYNTNVVPVFIEKREHEINVFQHNGQLKVVMLMVKS